MRSLIWLRMSGLRRRLHMARDESWRKRSDPVRGRRRALEEEVGYWQDWLASGGRRWPDEYAFRFDPTGEVADMALRGVIGSFEKDEVAILDVGSGPASMVGYQFPGKRLSVEAVDPLANDYNKLLEDAGVVPPVRPVPVAAAQLLEHFGPDRFDIAYSRNALDHAVDPMLAVENMLAVLRPGGYAVLRHIRNEAVRQRYVRLHQWNFDERVATISQLWLTQVSRHSFLPPHPRATRLSRPHPIHDA